MNKISIIVLVYNHWDITTRCLASVLSSPTEKDYEVILVDNGSEEPMPDFYPAMIPEIRIIRSESNRGYGGGYNFAAQFATGDLMVLLSTDIIVTPGWLDELVRVKSDNPGTLIVGPKYLMLDGRLLEAGSLIFNDGTPWALGRGDDARVPFFNFVRDAHYVSTACVLVDRDFFISTGGFDPIYGMGYFEDTDLCTRARHAGGRVMYTPFANILHQESSSFGGHKSQLMETNGRIFTNKWHDFLKEHYPEPAVSPLKASIAGARRSILVIDKFLPWHDRASGAKRTVEILRLLKQSNCHITFAAVDGRNQDSYVQHLQMMGIEVVWNDGPAIGMPELGAIPWEQLLQHREYDYVWLTFWDVAAYYLERFRNLRLDARLIVDSVDLEFARLAAEAVTTGTGSFNRERSLREIAAYQAADIVITVSDLERDMLRKTGISNRIEVLPNIHEVIQTVPHLDHTSSRRDLLFVGNFNHRPNRDAILMFARNIFPHLHQRLQVNLLIAGNNPTDDVLELQTMPGIKVLGWVPDLAPVYNSVLAAIAPLRYGAGIKGKISEALSMAVPVIASPEALVGMEVVVEKEAVLVASVSNPNQWFAAVTKLLEPDFWNALSVKGWEVCSKLYGRGSAREILEQIIR